VKQFLNNDRQGEERSPDAKTTGQYTPSVKNPQHMQIADTILTRQIEQITEFVTTSRHKLFLKDVFRWYQDSEITIYGRSSHTSVVINEKLYIIGGMDSKSPKNQFTCSDDILIYDLSKRDKVNFYRETAMG